MNINPLTADVLHVSHEMVLACSGCSASQSHRKIIKNGPDVLKEEKILEILTL